MTNSHIDIDGKYGLNFQHIYFTPDTDIQVLYQDRIVNENGYEFQCMGMNEYRYINNDPTRFVPGIELLKKFKVNPLK